MDRSEPTASLSEGYFEIEIAHVIHFGARNECDPFETRILTNGRWSDGMARIFRTCQGNITLGEGRAKGDALSRCAPYFQSVGGKRRTKVGRLIVVFFDQLARMIVLEQSWT